MPPRASSNLLTAGSFPLGDQGNSSKMSGFEWKTSRFEWKTSMFRGKGAAEADDLLEVPATG